MRSFLLLVCALTLHAQTSVFHKPGAPVQPGAPCSISVGCTGATTAAAALASLGAVSLTGNYVNPAWLVSLDWSKITGVPAFGWTDDGATVTATVGRNLALTGRATITVSAGTDQVLKIQNTSPTGLSGYVAQDDTGTKYLTFGVQSSSGLTGTYGLPGEGIVRASSGATGLTMSVFSGPFRVITTSGSVERFRVENNGSVGVGIAPTTGTKLDVAGPIRHAPAAFSTLTACSAALEGTAAAVNDSTTAVWGATVTGTGANHVRAYCDGTNWTVAAK